MLNYNYNSRNQRFFEFLYKNCLRLSYSNLRTPPYRTSRDASTGQRTGRTEAETRRWVLEAGENSEI